MFDDCNLNLPAEILERVQGYATDHWPEMADADRRVTAYQPQTPSPALLTKLNGHAEDYKAAVRERASSYSTAASPISDHYTVTWRKSVRTASGADLHKIARVVIDERGNVLKASSSKLANKEGRGAPFAHDRMNQPQARCLRLLHCSVRRRVPP